METMHKDQHGKQGHYGRLLLMTALSFVAMFILMYAMVDRFANVYANFNQVYMAGLMAAPMVLIEMALMRSMYPNAKLNGVIILATLLVMILCWVFIRQQTAISDNQFVRSMIPHHAGAVLMCEENQLKDPDLVQLCQEIISSQKAEIALMTSKLK
ncbi:MAG: DUF305 domain-containing protein [Xanthomonadales bacterium]|nr:DUF305 domain-containing protein [Xanthomonadales bacterium]